MLFYLILIQPFVIRCVLPLWRIMTTSPPVLDVLPRPCPWPLFPSFFSNDIWFTSRNGVEPVGGDWWFLNRSSLFCSATRRHDISFEYFSNLRSRYCCCKSIFKAWNLVNVFSNMSSSVTFSPHNFNCEVILSSVELYSLHFWNLATLGASNHNELLGGYTYVVLISLLQFFSTGIGDLFLWGTQFLIPHGDEGKWKSLPLPNFVGIPHCHL